MRHRHLSPTDTKRPLFVYLRGILASLKAAERLIAECVLADPEKVITSTILTPALLIFRVLFTKIMLKLT